jgi:hypothetical protein
LYDSVKKLFSRKLKQSGIRTLLAGCQLYLNNLATHFHNPLLLTKPVIVGHQLGEIGVL